MNENTGKNEISENDIIAALRKLGVTEGDLLLVHASASKCGRITDGPGAIIHAIRKAIGADGTALFATFTYPFSYLGGEMSGCRPHDPDDPAQVWTGLVPQTLLREFPGARRSAHITHSWAGFGPLAEACVNGHGATDPPASANSPMGEALRRGGRILYFGCDVGNTTFLHYLEDYFNLPYLGTATCMIKNRDGGFSSAAVEKHLPGHRDFYRKDGENSKFFQRAKNSGLKINRAPLKNGELKLINLSELFEIGSRLLNEDSRILLCDNPDCEFCRKVFK